MGIATKEDNLEIGTDITRLTPCDVGTTKDNRAVTTSRVSLNN